MYRKTEVQPDNNSQKADPAKKLIHKRYLLKFYKIPSLFSNRYFKVRGQKAYCDGHTDKVVYTISCALW